MLWVARRISASSTRASLGIPPGHAEGLSTASTMATISSAVTVPYPSQSPSQGVEGGEVTVGVGVGRDRIGVGVETHPVAPARRHTPGAERLQSLSSTHEKSVNSPLSQTRPVAAQVAPWQCSARRQPNALNIPLEQIWCALRQVFPPQVNRATLKQPPPSNGPPTHFASSAPPTQLPSGQSHGEPSN